jgi:hypothetical protein
MLRSDKRNMRIVRETDVTLQESAAQDGLPACFFAKRAIIPLWHGIGQLGRAPAYQAGGPPAPSSPGG